MPHAEQSVLARLQDAPCPGAPAKISAEVYCQIMALTCQPPESFGRPTSHWTARELANEAIQQGLALTICPVRWAFNRRTLNPHLNHYWLTAKQDPDKDTKIEAICSLSEQRPLYPLWANGYSLHMR